MNRLLSLTLFALVAGPAGGQPPPAEPVRAVVRAAVEKGTIPGAVVLVTHAGRPVVAEAFGQATADRPMTADAIFRIASMTKPVTSVAVLMLAEDGKLRLDDPLVKHLPEFADAKVTDGKAGTVAATRAVTIRDLLTHTSGIAYGLNPPEPLKKAFADAKIADGLTVPDPPLADNVRKLAAIPLAHQPGAAWTYGMNTDVLGRVVEVASGKPFDAFLAERIFTPLKMADTGFRVPADKAGRLVTLYTPGGDSRVAPITADRRSNGAFTVDPDRPLGRVTYLSGGAGLVSTAADYTRFLRMLLNDGELDGVRVLRATSVRDMTRNQIGDLGCQFPIHGDKFGLGVGVTTALGGPASVGSYSWGGAYHTFFWVDPPRKLTAVVMTQIWPWGGSTLWPDLQKAVYASLPPEKGPTPPDEQRRQAMNKPGDAKRGRALFASAALKCAVCHKVAGQGGEAGPDLSLVAGKYDRTHLIEAVLDPSGQILEGFRTTVVTLADGRTLSGIVSNETANGFTLRDAENKVHQIAKGDVEKRTTDAKSLMPADLCAGLSPAEFSDLIAYLGTLRSGRSLSPGEGITGAIELPAGFLAEPVATGFTGTTGMAVAADGRVFVCEQTGALRVVKGGKLLAEPFVKLDVAAVHERGLLGVAVAPGFPKTPHVYVLYVAAKPHPHHVVSRLTADGDAAVAGSEEVLFTGDDQTKLGGNTQAGHQGGPIAFGTDGKLYVALGDQTAETPAQRLDTLQGKILRLNPDGSIPADNPFVTKTTGKYLAIWALGCRNPFGMAVQPGTGRVFINDVGGKAEEINEGVAGANFGWPTADHGPTDHPAFRGPAHHYPTACITGGAFGPNGEVWRGRYYFADFNHGFIRSIDPTDPAKATGFATGVRRPTALAFGPDGHLYVLVRDAWLLDKSFKSNTGTLLRVRHETSAGR